MASYYKPKDRKGYVVQVFIRCKLRKLWIGDCSATQAKAIAAHLERLKVAAETATAADPTTTRWANSVGPRIQSQLAKWGLIEHGTSFATIPKTLAAFVDHYIETMLAGSAPSTRKRWSNVKRHLTANWLESTTLKSVTVGDCQLFARKLRSQFKPSHAGKLIGDAKQLFDSALSHRIIADNPFSGIDLDDKHDESREFYLPKAEALKIIEAADPYYACLIALARFGGLRVPSEPLGLRWIDVDLPGGRFTVTDQKRSTTRVIPIFPELAARLERLQELAADGSELVFDRARSSAGTTWREALEKYARAASVPLWPKLWQNLRASCRTDLEETFPEHVINEWLGHSGRVGRKHYTRVHEEHFRKAVGDESKDCGRSETASGEPAR